MDNKTTISFNSQNNDMMTGGAQARLRPSLIPLFSSVRLSRLSSNKSSSVPSVFLGLKGLKGEKRGEKGRMLCAIME